jgi:hypothetical protein
MRIVFTAFNRPNYMRQVLDTWRLVRGVKDVVLDFHIEPGCPEMEQVCQEASTFATAILHVNQSRMGVQVNPFLAFDCGFEQSDFVILAEDDMVVGTDTLEYFRWAEEKYRDRQDVLGLTAARRQLAGDPPFADAATLAHYGEFWVWGTWRNRWTSMIRPDWKFNYEYNGWDMRLNDYWCRERGMRMLTPNLSRVQHIGREGGIHCMPDMFEALLSPCFLPEAEPQDYFVVGDLWPSVAVAESLSCTTG